MMARVDDPETQRANAAFIRASMREPLLARDHELELARRWRDGADEKALHQLVRAYTRLVVAVAARLRHYGIAMGDLIQEGNVGLMQAAARFEPARDVRFSTYAAWWIRASMQDHILRNWSIVRTGTTAAHKSLFFNLRRLRARIADNPSSEHLSDDARRQIAQALDVDAGEVTTMEMRLAACDRSLNAVMDADGEAEWQDILPDSRPTPEEVVIGMRDGRMRSKWLAAALGELSPRERRIIAERRLREEGASLEELGRAMGVSKERVRQLESRAMTKLRTSMMKHVTDGRDLLMAV